MSNLPKKHADTLLKEATAKKKAGDLETAINLLRDAYQEIGEGSIIHPVNAFLRLPSYLQEAKRTDEAWREFNLLLTKGYPNQKKDPEAIPMDHSIVYDRMRLFLQREGKGELAVRFGIFSYLSRATGLYRQERKDELKKYTSREAFERTIRNLLKKPRKEYLVERISTIVEEQIKRIPNIDFGELAEEIDELFIR